MIAASNPPPLASFSLTDSEEVFFRARSARAVADLARKTSAFKAYYQLRPARPFRTILGVTAPIVTFGLAAGVFLILRAKGHTELYPLLAACGAITVAAVGWCVAAWIAHRNAVRQNTTNIIFARFSQAPFGDAMHRFHFTFGNDISDGVTYERIAALRATGNEDDRRTAASVTYLLNYFEFIASGTLNGDLDANIVRQNLRSVICFYYDKFRPYIDWSIARGPSIFEHLVKLRTHYRKP